MDPKVVEFIVGSIKEQVPVEKILQGLMQQFGMSQEEAQNTLRAVVAEVQKQQGAKAQDAKRGNNSPEKVLAILDELGINASEAAILIKEIFALGQNGLKELLIVLTEAVQQGEGQRQEQAPPQEQGPPPPPEGMSADPMENI